MGAELSIQTKDGQPQLVRVSDELAAAIANGDTVTINGASYRTTKRASKDDSEASE